MSIALKPLPETYGRTRDDLHRLAVYAVSPAQRLTNGEIIMRSSHGGFETFEYGGHLTRVVDDRLVLDGAAHPITTLREAAAFLGIEPDVGQQEQFDVPPHGDLDEPLAIDLAATAVLGDWFEFATDALEALRDEAAPEDEVTIVRIWPEHFDAAIDMGDAAANRRATYGGSPGDRHHAEPYLYASPWAGRVDPFFDDPGFKGAALPYAELLAAADPAATAIEFLREARDRVRVVQPGG
ncbi:MAG TPA: hypothetical protein VFI18_06225 [Gaiellales bacterium]|nr:hypothetical protein [Gaiellales bacterium]